MKLKTAVSVSAILTLSVFGTLSYSLIRNSDRMNSSAHELADAGEAVRLAKELKSKLLLHNRNVFLHSFIGDEDRAKSRPAQNAEIMAILDSAEKMVNTPDDARVLAEVKRQIMIYLERRDQLAKSSMSSLDQYHQISDQVDLAIAAIDKLVIANRARKSAILEAINLRSEEADSMAFLYLACGGLILAGTLIYGLFAVTRPLAGLAKTIRNYSAGDEMARAKPKGLEEIQRIANNFNNMADRLAEKQQDQLRFIASVAHDLRNPLYSISMASELLLKQSPKESRKLLETLERQVKNLDRLVGDLLDTAHIEAGQLTLRLYDTNLRTLITDLLELHRATTNRHTLKLEMPCDSFVYRCDGTRISQVLNNLLSNAIKYSPNGGNVTVTVGKEDGGVFISVTDQGIGISAPDLEHIFKPFQRMEPTEGGIPGIGLGLSTSRRIVEAHGGKLTVTSIAGVGSTFRVYLPIIEGAQPSKPFKAAQSAEI